MHTFEVAVVYKGQCNFIVEAASEEEAKQIAEIKFKNGDRPDDLGNEWEKIDLINGEIIDDRFLDRRCNQS